jgi:hypothetical protein
MSAATKRGLIAALVTAVVLTAIGLYIGLYLVNVPGSVAATESSSGATLNLATVAAAKGTDPHPTWVSYYAVNADDTNWRHATTYTLPANTVVHVTIYQFDGQSGLRNEFLSQSSGTIGGNFLLNGKPTQAIDPTTASHVFAIPAIGLSVPLEGVADNAKNPCANAPCPLSTAHFTIQFSFRTPGKGLYRWQCFVPCAAGFIAGFGGPMQTVGYMDGFIHVV